MRHSQACDSDVSGTTMLELIATLVVDLSDQTLTVLNEQEQTVRVIPVSTGKASSPTHTHGPCLRTHEIPLGHHARTHLCFPWQEDAGQAFGVPRSHGCVRMPTLQARWLFANTPKGTKVIIQA